MKIGIHGKPFIAETVDYIQHFFDLMSKRSAQLFISEEFYQALKDFSVNTGECNVYKANQDLGFLDVLMTLGGDGTLLEAITQIGASDVPLMGINTGRLGFLATIAKENIEPALDLLFRKDFTYEERALLSLKSDTLFDGVNFALNDFTILKKDTASMITVNVYMNDSFINSYWADGIIVSTPTGSTGYNLSCGGPLILPGSNNFVITPVSPHTLTVRPLVVPDNVRLSFTIEGRSDNYLISLDSRFETVDNSVKLIIEREKFNAKLIKLNDYSYFKTLRRKLNWGLDVRN